MTHGGGATPVTQTNDVHLHKPFRSEVCDMQHAAIIEKARTADGGLQECSDEELIAIFAIVASNTELHLGACHGYKQTGTTVALDGSEDHLIAGDASEFWDRLGVRERINSAVAEIDRRYAEGLLIWDFDHVQKEIIPYPKRKELDEMVWGNYGR